ncbi:H-NS family nucleoid-associated regulatory protein [Burkholderia metallica]|uniref:H-NS histone family protein n=1 Tax=Burkholderia metallica TaxID=488729 RepID=UPI00158C1B10|nr:H-NS histone family protein [Burkholderia metallica]
MDSPTLPALRAELDALNIELARVRAQEKKAALAAFKEQVALYDITQQEVLSALGYLQPKRRRAPAQFYDPSSGRSWSGHGPRPKWLADKNLDDYRVDRVPQPWCPDDEAA